MKQQLQPERRLPWSSSELYVIVNTTIKVVRIEFVLLLMRLRVRKPNKAPHTTFVLSI